MFAGFEPEHIRKITLFVAFTLVVLTQGVIHFGATNAGRPLRCGARTMSPHRPSRRAWQIATSARNSADSIPEDHALEPVERRSLSLDGSGSGAPQARYDKNISTQSNRIDRREK